MSAHRPPPFDAPAAARAIAAADPELGVHIARLEARLGPCALRLQPTAAPFPSLARAIVFQQLSGKAARTIHARLVERLGGALTPGAVRAARLDRLRGAGLSRAKALALRDLAAKVEDGTVPSARALARMDDEAIVERLCAVRGIGRWTAEMHLMFTLGRPDVIALGDLGLRKGFRKAFGMTRLPAPSTFARRAERWRPWRTVACWYLWRIADEAEDSW